MDPRSPSKCDKETILVVDHTITNSAKKSKYSMVTYEQVANIDIQPKPKPVRPKHYNTKNKR